MGSIRKDDAQEGLRVEIETEQERRPGVAKVAMGEDPVKCYFPTSS